MCKWTRLLFLALVAPHLTLAAWADPESSLDSNESSDLSSDSASDLTSGWTADDLRFKIQAPYDVKSSDRYTFQDGAYHFWVMSTDQPFSKGNKTLPRTEMRFPDYTSGQHQYEADMMVPPGTDNVTIMQIHTGDADEHRYGPVAFMLQVHHGGNLYQGNRPPELMSNIYNKWFHLNVINDMTARKVLVYIDGKLVGTYKDPGAPSNYFKCGVYTCRGGSAKMEVYIKNIKIWHKD
ncbi:MAG TPA: polysaccharide lyase family 7 protein [Candidatus Methylacidiphilales bacterium]|nr:polysaccharide lyase family 7 protein [Candidatus Methylacidiphilales bacterium]